MGYNNHIVNAKEVKQMKQSEKDLVERIMDGANQLDPHLRDMLLCYTEGMVAAVQAAKSKTA